MPQISEVKTHTGDFAHTHTLIIIIELSLFRLIVEMMKIIF